MTISMNIKHKWKMEKKENSDPLNVKDSDYAQNLIERTYECVARTALYPAWKEIDELKGKLAASETMVKRLEKEKKRKEDRANMFEKESLLWKSMWSIFGNNKHENNEQPIKNK